MTIVSCQPRQQPRTGRQLGGSGLPRLPATRNSADQWRVSIGQRLTIEVKFSGWHRGGALDDGLLLSVERPEGPGLSVSWDSNVATAANAEAELIGAPIPRPLCAPMKSEPDRPMTLGNAAKAELRLIVW